MWSGPSCVPVSVMGIGDELRTSRALWVSLVEPLTLSGDTPIVRTYVLHIRLTEVGYSNERESGWWRGLSDDLPAAVEVVPGQPGMSGLPGQAALAAGLRLPGLRGSRVLAYWNRIVDVPRLPAEDIGDRRHDLPPHADPVVDMVRRDLVPDLAEERDVRARPAAGPRVRLLRDGVGVAAQAASGDGSPRAGQALRGRRARRDHDRGGWPTAPAAGTATMLP